MRSVIDRGRYVRIDAVNDETLYVSHTAAAGETCAYCDRPINRHSGESRDVARRLSTGFGAANKLLLRFCDRFCRGMLSLRGRARDVEPAPPWRDVEQTMLATALPVPAPRVAPDGGRNRPDDCECWNPATALPCFVCWKAGFEAPNPHTNADE